MEKLYEKRQLGKTGIVIPPVIFGTSCLGNLYRALSDDIKLDIMHQWFEYVDTPVVIDTAGKYGAGLALEVIGDGLRELGIEPEQITISNKLGWIRTPLTTPEPTFEPGVWADYPISTNLIKNITPQNFSEIVPFLDDSADIDVTGGMYNKVQQSLTLVQGIPGLEVSIFSGDTPGAVNRSLLGAREGTTIMQINGFSE